jgi:hypothetical protein
MVKRFRYWPTFFAAVVASFLMPTYCLVRHAIDPRYLFGRVEIALWPTSIMLMATDGSEGTPGAYVVIAMSVAANMFLYIAGFSAVWAFARLIRLSSRDGTTI